MRLVFTWNYFAHLHRTLTIWTSRGPYGKFSWNIVPGKFISANGACVMIFQI